MVSLPNYLCDDCLRRFTGELRVLFAQDDTYQGYLDRYFALNPSTAISWIHDLGSGRHEAAAAALVHESEQATNLDAKHVSVSSAFMGVSRVLNSSSHDEAHAEYRKAFASGGAT